MKRIAIFAVIINLILSFSSYAAGDGINQTLGGTSVSEMASLYTSGGTDPVTGNTYNTLENGDVFILTETATGRYVPYIFDIDSGLTETGTNHIQPDNISSGTPYTGDGRWDLMSGDFQSVTGKQIGKTYHTNEYLVGDGITDDYTALQALLTSLADGSTVEFDPTQTYALSAPVSCTAKNITFKGNDCTITSPAGFLRNVDFISTYTTLGISFSEGDNTFTIPDGVSVTEGQYIIATQTGSPYPTTGYYYGVGARVLDVTGTTATISHAPFGSFTADKLLVRGFGDGIRVSGFNIDMSSANSYDDYAIRVGGIDIEVSGCRITGSEAAGIGIWVNLGIGANIHDNIIDKFLNTGGIPGTTGRLGYGIAVSGHNINVSGNVIHNAKHCIMGGDREYYSSNLRYVGNYVQQDDIYYDTTCTHESITEPKTAQPLDCHGVVDHVLMEGNYVYGLGASTSTDRGIIGIRNGNATISNNHLVYANGSTGDELIRVYETTPTSIVLTGNTIETSKTLNLFNSTYTIGYDILKSSGNTVSGTITHNGYPISDGIIYIQATIPTSPVIGMKWIRNTSGAIIEFTYNGTTWVPVRAHGNVILYVDGTDGTDDFAHGYGADSAAVATWDQVEKMIPADIGSSNVTVYITAETYNETQDLRGRSGSGTIYLCGTQTAVISGLTADAYTAGSGATRGNVQDSGAFGSVAVGDIVYNSGLQVYRTVYSVDSADQITIVGTWGGSPSGTYSVYRPGTIFSGAHTRSYALDLTYNSCTVVVSDIQYYDGATNSYYAGGFSRTVFHRCHFTSTSDSGTYVMQHGGPSIYDTFIQCYINPAGNKNGTYFQWPGQLAFFNNCLFGTTTQIALNVIHSGAEALLYGGSSIIGTGIGIVVKKGGYVDFGNSSGSGYEGIANCSTGIAVGQEESGGIVTDLDNIVWSGNTNNVLITPGSGAQVEGYSYLSGTTTWNPGSIASGSTLSTTVTVTGAALGDAVIVSDSVSLCGLSLTGYVSGDNTVTVVLNNNTGGAVDLASGTITAKIWRN